MPCTNGENPGVSDPPKIRRLRLVPRPAEAAESPLAGAAAVRRYRLARMERVAEASPADADRPGPRVVGERDRRAAEGLG
jgi:hypothetical protein